MDLSIRHYEERRNDVQCRKVGGRVTRIVDWELEERALGTKAQTFAQEAGLYDE
jgi:hypothetical protein